jgi:hypothetical protein
MEGNTKKETGLTYIIVGTLLLFYMFGILTRSFIIILAAIYMIVRGIMISGYHKKIMQMIGIENK